MTNIPPWQPMPKEEPEVLLTDKQIANLLNLSPAWIRKERYKRRRGEAHSLSVDPVMLGDTPRYKSSEIESWLAQL